MGAGSTAFGSGREATLADKRLAKREAWATVTDTLQTKHSLYLGDARSMAELPDGTCVHLVVTSPPYWDLKQYPGRGKGLQLGNVTDRREFLDELGKVWRRCLELLVPGGRMCVVVGDVCRARRRFGRHFVEPLHAHVLLQCQELGFDPLAPIIWNKIANVSTEAAGNGASFLGKPYEPNAIIKNDIEYILLLRKPGAYRHPTSQQRALSLIDKEDYALWYQQVWNDVPGDSRRDHPAPFPVEIARRLIGMFSFVGDTVLDPFSGVANTTAAAIHMHRSSIGFELEPEYFRAAREALGSTRDGAEVRFCEP